MLKLKKNNKDKPKGKGSGQPAGSPQGIVAKGNALKAIAFSALLAAMVPLALGFSYLVLLREPALQTQQIERVALSFATQQATNIHHLMTRLKARIYSAAGSPLALSAIASQDRGDIDLVEKAMLDYFPEVISLRIVTIGDMGTAEIEGGENGLRNHIEVDLVRRTSMDQQTQPEAYKFENRWMTSMTALVTHPRIADRKAVIIITLDNEQIASHLKSLDTAAGKFAVEQTYSGSSGAASTNIIAFAGSGDGSDYTQRASIPETPWQVAFTPSRGLLETLAIPPWPLYAVLALSVIALLCVIVLFLWRFPRKLDNEINRLISAADRKTPLELSIPELVGVARQLRRATLRTLRQSSAAPSSTSLPVAVIS